MINNYTKEQIIELLQGKDKDLFKKANEIKYLYKKNFIHFRGLIEFTNICKCHCKYCGLRCENKKVERYRLKEEEIISCANQAVKDGIKTIVLQGGEDKFWTQDKLVCLIKEIKKNDVALTLSIGERPKEDYKAFKDAGANRYLLRIETTNKNLYEQMHPYMSFENRIRCLKDLKSLGYETGTGVLVGLPNQTIESLADDILFFKELNADMIGIGPFIPHKDTPLANANNDNFDLALRVMAITRLVLKDINIPATTAMGTIRENGQLIALNSGANVIMPNYTDCEYDKNYEIYPNKLRTSRLYKEFYANHGFKMSQTQGFRTDNT